VTSSVRRPSAGCRSADCSHTMQPLSTRSVLPGFARFVLISADRQVKTVHGESVGRHVEFPPERLVQAGLWNRYTEAPTPTPRFLKLPTPTPTPTPRFLKLRL
jgi:hypothetical protein